MRVGGSQSDNVMKELYPGLPVMVNMVIYLLSYNLTQGLTKEHVGKLKLTVGT